MADRRRELWRAGVSAAVLLVTGLIARRSLSGWERRLFRSLNGANGVIAVVLWTPMQFGAVVAPFVVAIGAYCWRRSLRIAIGTLVAGLTAWYVAPIVKHWVSRPRPAALVHHTVLHFGGTTHGFGFPSGHTAVAFAMATVLAAAVGRTGRVVVYAVAAIVALARVYVGAHLPLDVVGGAALGVVIGSLWNAIAAEQRDRGVAPPRPDAMT